MSISVKFETFCKNIRMEKTVVDNVSSRYKQITKRLNKDFYGTDSDINNSLYVGSYGRGTAIHVSDIDMLFTLPCSYYWQYDKYTTNGQSQLLQAVKNSISNTYFQTKLKGDGQVVVVEFSDGIKYEIVPCFLNTDQISFTYPDSNNGGSWKVTKPEHEINAINTLNNNTNKNLKRLCRMIRAWKDTCNVDMGGLLIDTMAHKFLKDWEYKNCSYSFYDYMTRDFFKFLSEQNDKQALWYAAGSNQYIYNDGLFVAKAKKAYNNALEAIQYEVKEYEWSANYKWREIYGNKFPN
ncbi:MAG: hypothetical protein H6Q15_1002 [Bacteroidetes bacterium]|nr:hypothetical protein [Bacteroidota bacterium]